MLKHEFKAFESWAPKISYRRALGALAIILRAQLWVSWTGSLYNCLLSYNYVVLGTLQFQNRNHWNSLLAHNQKVITGNCSKHVIQVPSSCCAQCQHSSSLLKTFSSIVLGHPLFLRPFGVHVRAILACPVWSIHNAYMSNPFSSSSSKYGAHCFLPCGL